MKAKTNIMREPERNEEKYRYISGGTYEKKYYEGAFGVTGCGNDTRSTRRIREGGI